MRKIMAALAIVAALMSMTACDKREDGPKKRQEPHANADEKYLTIQTFVESRNGPYDVYVHIEGGSGAYPPHVPVASGGWKHSIVYRTGVKMTLSVTLHYEGNPSKEGYCSITDGRGYNKDSLRSVRAKGGSPYEAVCTLTTSQ